MTAVSPHSTVLRAGVHHTVRYRVGEQQMVRKVLPGVAEFDRKPEVMATAWLVAVCEWPAMEVLREFMTDTQCSLGTRVDLSHCAPIVVDSILEVSAHCTRVDGARSEWAVQADDGHELVAKGTASFVVVEMAPFVKRRIEPKFRRCDEYQVPLSTRSNTSSAWENGCGVTPIGPNG